MSEEKLAGTGSSAEGTHCPSCGRFVGAFTRCPHCGARIRHRMSLTFFRYAAVLLATVGLFFLYLASTRREVPVVRIGEISPMMNFAYVRVQGTVSSEPRIFKEGGRVQSLRFAVDDGTGEIQVSAYRGQAESLLADNRVPNLGDKVDVAGSLSVSADDRLLLRLQVPEHLRLERRAPEVAELGALRPEDTGRRVVVEGVIRRVSAPRPGSRAPWVLTLEDDTGVAPLCFWEDAYVDISDKARLAPGTLVRAHVSVGTHRGELQLRLARGGDLEFLPEGGVRRLTAGPGAPLPTAVALSELTGEMVGQEVQIQGRVVAVRHPPEGSRAPHVIELEDGGRKVPLVYWDVVARHLSERTPETGAWVRAAGIVQVHRGQVQVKLQHSHDLSLGEVPPAAAVETWAEAKRVTVAEVTASWQGQRVEVNGTLGEPRSVRGGVIYPLSDDTGTIQVVLWDRRVPGPERDKLRPGRRVRVRGTVQEYRGTLEVVPASPQDIAVEAAGGGS